MSVRFAHAHSAAAHWQDAVAECTQTLQGFSGNLGFLYASDLYAPALPAILTALRSATDIGDWSGSVGLGVCTAGREALDRPALAVLAANLPQGSYTLLPPVSHEDDLLRYADRFELAGQAAAFGIVHGDPRNALIGELLPLVAQRTLTGFLTGGLSSSRYQTWQISGEVCEGGLSGVLFSREIGVITGLTQGVSPFADQHLITDCQDNVLIALDHRPALDVFEEAIGDALVRDLQRAAGEVFVGLPVAGSDTADYKVRPIIAIDPKNRLLAIGESVQPGDALLFGRRDAQAAVTDMRRMLEGLKSRLAGPPKGGLYFSCLGRGEGLFGPDSAELRLISAVLGEFPLAGFYANGEISHNRLYGYTGVLTLFT